MTNKSGTIIKAMNFIGYDAANLGCRELLYGIDFIINSGHTPKFPIIASNVLFTRDKPEWLNEYIIKRIGGLKVAVLGILPGTGFKTNKIKNYKILSPEATLKKLLPAVKKKSDFVILLSQTGYKPSFDLAAKIKGIDLVISGGWEKVSGSEINGTTRIVQTGVLGENLGILQASINVKTGRKSVGTGRLIVLNKNIPMDTNVLAIIKEGADTLEKDIKLTKKKKDAEQHKEFMKGLNLTPLEFKAKLEENPSGDRKTNHAYMQKKGIKIIMEECE